MPVRSAIASTDAPEQQRALDLEDPLGRRGPERGQNRLQRLVLQPVVGRRCAPTTQPVRSASSPRSPFWNASLKVRPMAMTSPTDFICVVSVGSAVGNFSNAKRGIFTTT